MTRTRIERAAASKLRPWAARIVQLEGPKRFLCCAAMAAVMSSAVAMVARDLAAERGAALDDSWANFGRVACAWCALNVALLFLLAHADASAPPRVDARAPRFAEYPLFAWLCPGAQQLAFFAPAAARLAAGWWSARAAASCARRPAREGALVAHAIASLAGMQLRELLAFDCDALLVAHHVATIALAALAWRALRADGDCALALATAAATSAMEAGSVGIVLWTVSGGGSRFWRAAYAAVLTASHAVVLVTGVVGHVLQRPGRWEGWLIFGVALRLMHARHAHMVAEVTAGAASGVFASAPKEKERPD